MIQILLNVGLHYVGTYSEKFSVTIDFVAHVSDKRGGSNGISLLPHAIL